MSKELWMAEHDRLVEEYLDAHPDADWTEAYECTADLVNDRLRDRLAAMADEAKDGKKYA